MRYGDTHMMFIDSDIGFNARDVIALLALQDPDDANDKYDIMAGPYPKKCISWEKIKTAVDKGFADENPNNLEKYVVITSSIPLVVRLRFRSVSQ
jgi:ABC-type proline/glycine betaine transport system substrate-binding protein